MNLGKIARAVRKALTWLTDHKDKLPLPGKLKDGLQKGRDAGLWQKGHGPKG
jgi:hypothetical protein